jgi:hypothetical protein
MKKESNIKIWDQNNNWWKNEKNITWAIKKGEDWWLIKNNEPKANANEKNPKSTENSHHNLKFYMACFAASMLGMSAAIGVCVILSWLL